MQQIKVVNLTTDYRDYLSADEISAIEHEIALFPDPHAAGIEALKIVQANRGWISDDSLEAIADMLGMSTAQLDGVATFFNLIYRQPVGKHVIHLCNSISCYLNDYEAIAETLQSHLNIGFGQTTEDGVFTLITNACLGACDKAPALMIGEKQYMDLTPESVIALLQQLKAEAEV